MTCLAPSIVPPSKKGSQPSQNPPDAIEVEEKMKVHKLGNVAHTSRIHSANPPISSSSRNWDCKGQLLPSNYVLACEDVYQRFI